jgi:hypothetical protein
MDAAGDQIAQIVSIARAVSRKLSSGQYTRSTNMIYGTDRPPQQAHAVAATAGWRKN